MSAVQHTQKTMQIAAHDFLEKNTTPFAGKKEKVGAFAGKMAHLAYPVIESLEKIKRNIPAFDYAVRFGFPTESINPCVSLEDMGVMIHTNLSRGALLFPSAQACFPEIMDLCAYIWIQRSGRLHVDTKALPEDKMAVYKSKGSGKMKACGKIDDDGFISKIEEELAGMAAKDLKGEKFPIIKDATAIHSQRQQRLFQIKLDAARSNWGLA